MALKLNKELEVGITLIDDQHRELINIINNLGSIQSFSKKETLDTIDSIKEYALEHFRVEEELHQKYGYPFADAHSLLHRTFLSELETIIEDFKLKEDTYKFLFALQQFITT